LALLSTTLLPELAFNLDGLTTEKAVQKLVRDYKTTFQRGIDDKLMMIKPLSKVTL
jgi:hypothetical protein